MKQIINNEEVTMQYPGNPHKRDKDTVTVTVKEVFLRKLMDILRDDVTTLAHITELMNVVDETLLAWKKLWLQSLNDSEVYIFHGMSLGKTSKEIAYKAQMSLRAVHYHRKKLAKKMGCKTSDALMLHAGMLRFVLEVCEHHDKKKG